MTNEHTEASMTQELYKLAIDAIVAANGDWMHTDGSQGMARERALVLYTYAVEPATILALLDRLEKAEKDAGRWRRLVNASEMEFPVLTIASDPENDCWLPYGREDLESLVDMCDEIPNTYQSIDAAMEASK